MRSALPVVLLGAAAVVAAATRIEDPRDLLPVGAVALLLAVALVWMGARLRRPRIRDWRDAEHGAALWLRKAGCREVSLTGGSADGGLDVVTANWAVQVKHTSKRVGRPVVQQVVGAALTLGLQPAVVSTGGFTSPAIAYADEHEVALLELDLDGRVYRCNQTAHRVGKRSGRAQRR